MPDLATRARLHNQQLNQSLIFDQTQQLMIDGQWWRLLSCCFLHFGIFHLGMNLYSLFATGNKLESFWGKSRYLVLYLLAGQAILERDHDVDRPTSVAGGVFWHLRDGKTSGEIHTNTNKGEAALQSAREHLSRHLQQGRSGKFTVQPSKGGGAACSHYCEFSHLCRVSIMNRKRKAD